MATRLDKDPDKKSEDKSQEHYDKQFNELTASEHLNKNEQEPDLDELEESPENDFYDATEELANKELPANREFSYSAGPRKRKFKIRERWKGLAIGGGLFGIIGGIVGLLFIFLPSLKVTHVLNNLEGRFYGVAANAIESRAEHLMSRYMRNSVFPSVRTCGTVVSSDCAGFSPGRGIATNLFRTWHDARIEEKLFTEQGIRIEHRTGNNYSITTRAGSSITVDGDTFDFEELRRRDGVSARVVRRELRQSLRNETHWYQLMYRRSIRNLASRKYNIRWCVFACDTRDNVRESSISALQRLKLKLIERTIGPFSDRLGLYFTCAVTDCTDREFITERSRLVNRAVEELGEETTQRIISETSDRRLSQVLVEKIVSKVFGTTAGRGAASAVPIVGWLYAIDAVNQIDTQLYNGVISQFLADNVAAQYAEGYLTYKTNYDEGIDGQLSLEEVGAQSQLLDGMEKSRVYQRDLGSGATDSIGPNLFTPAHAQSEQEEYLCADDQPIPEGELVCEERKVGKLSGYDSWRQSETAASISGLVIGGYRCGPFTLISALNPDFCEPDSLADNVYFIDDVLHAAFAQLNSVLDAVGGFLFSLVPDSLTEFISNIVSDITRFLLETVFPFIEPLTGPGRQVFDDLYAGADVVGNEFAKGFEDPLTNEFVGLGGRKLTDEEIEENIAYYEQKRQEEFKSKSFFARLFSPDESKSLLSTVAMSIPVSPGIDGASRSLASLLNPAGLLAHAGSGMLNPIYAQDTQYDGDPFGIHQYGYAVDDEMLTLDPEEITPESCSPGGDLYESWQEGVQTETVEGQVVHETTNPCMLEYVTTNILSCWFTESDDCGVDNNNVVAPTNNDGVSGSTSPVDGLVTHPDLGPVLSNGYYEMPPAPNGEYSFWSATPPSQRCGSRALVDLIYTVSVRWYQKYPSDRILVGDLNAIGHATHKNGVNWDIWLESSNANGSFGTVQKAKELGRLLADTGIIKSILYNVTQVQNDFNTYVAQNNLPGSMSYYDGHFNHMHLTISDEFRGPDSTSCSDGTTVFNYSPVIARYEDAAA